MGLFYLFTGFRTQNRPARSLVTVLNELPRLLTNQRWQNLKFQTPQVPKLAYRQDPDTLPFTFRHQALLPATSPLLQSSQSLWVSKWPFSTTVSHQNPIHIPCFPAQCTYSALVTFLPITVGASTDGNHTFHCPDTVDLRLCVLMTATINYYILRCDAVQSGINMRRLWRNCRPCLQGAIGQR